MNTDQQTVFLHVWSGAEADAMRIAQARYPGRRIVPLSHRELRAAGWRGQLRCLRQLRGCAVVFYFQELTGQPQIQLLPWSGLIHRCRETVLADASGRADVYRASDLLRAMPRTLLSVLLDSAVFAFFWILLNLLRPFPKSVPLEEARPETGLEIAYLFPYPLNRASVGGAMSHVRGFLSGLAEAGARCEIYSGCPLPSEQFAVKVFPARRQFFVFWESLMLTYNLRFVRSVYAELKGRGARAFYQRHGRFVVAGALLARCLRIPLVLEYNGSEVWLAENWDPSRFKPWLRLCEDVALAAASLVVVVSEPLREELIHRGIPPQRILVNPNAVDPAVFHPECGGESVRKRFGFGPADVVVGFLGTFGYWHGVEVLQRAIQILLEDPARQSESKRLRFLLVGDGLLRAEMIRALQSHQEAGRVIFTGAIPHGQVPAHLDACDILVSPHVPMRDGRAFFGSPTKLFEYMAMGKAIAASRLDQLAQVLEHRKTAWLVTPGDAQELADALDRLAGDAELCRHLGGNARRVAVEQHTWCGNAARLLDCAGIPAQSVPPEASEPIPDWEQRPLSEVGASPDES